MNFHTLFSTATAAGDLLRRCRGWDIGIIAYYGSWLDPLYDNGALAQGGNKHEWVDAVRQFDVSRSPANRQHVLVGSILHAVDRLNHAKGRNRATPR